MTHEPLNGSTGNSPNVDETLALIRRMATQAVAQTPTARDPSAWRIQQAMYTGAQMVTYLDLARHVINDDLERYVEAYLEAYSAAEAQRLQHAQPSQPC